ncbi:Phage integrase family protein [Geodermatophilus africanus]|uniref:Phage integrase family protein n=1 Tax=Geodermatophilus africanus TaxID=1137993 RepID=A0A1H3LCK3_9ACTN|nr:tyrosine-type recombinase/integrase [Geodermatophilus africanus]SDY62121.1 Phage integrase family protein [Geodermatophilus africanus]
MTGGGTSPAVLSLMNYARSMNMSPAQVRAAADVLAEDRPEPALRTLVAEALRHDDQLRGYYARQMTLLLDGLPSYADAADRLVPAFPGFGDKRPSEVEASRLQDLLYAVGRESAARTLRDAAAHGHPRMSYDPDAHGHGAEERFRLAVRKLFRRSEVRKWIHEDPTDGLKRKQGGADFAHHLTVGQFAHWLAVACTTGDDPELDRLLLLLLRHTGLRQEALLNLTLDAIDTAACQLRASAKFGYTQPLPVNRQLLQEIVTLAQVRGSRAGSDPAFRYRNGRPLTGRRFDTLSKRLKARHAWAAPLSIGPHAIRRLTEDEVEARFGLAELTVWAGHSWKALPVSYRYVKKPGFARLREVAEDLFGPLDAPLPPSSAAAGVFAAPYGIAPRSRVSGGMPATGSTLQRPPVPAASVEPTGRPSARSVEHAPGVTSADAPLFGRDEPAALSGTGEPGPGSAPGRPLFTDGDQA